MVRRVIRQRLTGDGTHRKRRIAIIENLLSVTSSNIPIVSVPAAFADLRREAAAGRCSGLAGSEHGGRNPPDRGERGDVLSVAAGVRRAEDRAGEAPEGP